MALTVETVKAGNPVRSKSSTCMSSSLSPLTGVIEESNVIVDFGEFEGKTVEEIKAIDPDFYTQLVQAKEADSVAIRRNKDKSFRLYMNPLLSKANH